MDKKIVIILNENKLKNNNMKSAFFLAVQRSGVCQGCRLM